MIIFVAVLHFVNMFKNHTDLEILIYFHSNRNISSFPLQKLYIYLPKLTRIMFCFPVRKVREYGLTTGKVTRTEGLINKGTTTDVRTPRA